MSEDWVESTLGKILTFEYGKSLTERARDNEGSPVFGSNGEVGRHSKPLVGGPGIIVGRKGTAGSVTWSDEDFFPIDTTYWVRLNDDEALDLRFVHLLLSHADLPGVCAQTGVPGLNRERAYEVAASVPPLPVQRRIVDLLEHLDTLIANLEQEREAAEGLLTSLRERLLTPSAGWSDSTLGELLEISRGGSPRPIEDYLTEEADGVNWIKIGDAPIGGKYIVSTAQRIREAGVNRSRRVSPGDFILSNSMSFGRPYILRIPGCVHDGWLVLANVKEHFDEHFLHALLSSRSVSQQFDSLAAGSGVRNLNIRVVRSVQVSIPDKAVQRKIAAQIIPVEGLLERLVGEIGPLQDLRSATLTSLLSREIEIPESYDELLGVAS